MSDYMFERKKRNHKKNKNHRKDTYKAKARAQYRKRKERLSQEGYDD